MPQLAARAAIAAALVAAAGLGAGAWFAFGPGGESDRFAQCRNTAMAGGGAIGGPFELTDQTGARVTEAETIDALSMVYFGYTWCPDICPFDVARMAEVTDLLAERGLEVNPVFITVDPQRDTQAVLADYAERLHPRLTALTGAPEDIDAAAKAYRVYYAKAGDQPRDYLMDHSTFTYLMHPEHGFLDVFRRELSAEAMADRVQCFAEAS